MTGLADLHRHLDGSLRLETVRELAALEGIAVPAESALRFHAGMGLSEALARFAFTLSLLQTTSAVERVAREICEDAEREGVTTLELRFAPQLHLQRGLPIEAIVDAALEGVKGRAGVILCGLYGEPVSMLQTLVELARTRQQIVAIDLAGGPSPAHTTKLADYAPAFKQARELGIGRTVHAAEGRPAEEIRVAIEVLFAERIGHGTTLLDDPEITELVARRGITIEACPSSNVHTGVIPSVEAHPIAKWFELGVKACINTDNTLLSAVDAPEEYRRARTIHGMTDELLRRATSFGHTAAFSRS